MSGIVAVITSGEGRGTGRRGLGLIKHDDTWNTVEKQAGDTWLGATGRGDGCQAASLEDGDLTAIFCGRLSNQHVLARELGLSSPDPARTVVAAYARWELRGLDRLEGAFAYVLVHKSRSLVVAGADPAGVFRQHVVSLGDDVLIATEAKAFLAHPRFRPALDPLAAGELLTFGYLLHGRSLFRGVRATAHGCRVEVRDRRPRVVRSWDIRDDLGRGAWGAPYRARLHDAALELIGEGFSQGDERLPVLLPLTGGLDSRLLAAAAPRDAHVTAVTFGTPTEPDAVLGARVAEARGWPRQLEPLDPDHVRREAAATVWASEGRLNPVANLTGSLMRRLPGHDAFVSGVAGEVGRHVWKARMLMVDWPLLHADDAAFERRFRAYLKEASVEPSGLRRVAGPGLRRGLDAADEELDRAFAHTRGLEPVDRVDLFIAMQRIREFTQPGLSFAELWVDVKAPFLSRRWLAAVLSGSPAERCDDLVRLRLIRGLDPAVARVPWALTRLPLDASIPLVAAFRGASLAAHRLAERRRDGADEDPETSRSGDAAPSALAAASARMLLSAKRRVYRHGDRRNEWLRREGNDYLRRTLLAPQQGDEPLLDERATAELIRAHLAGADHALVLGQLLNLRLWERLFVEQDTALRERAHRRLGGDDEAASGASLLAAA